MANHAEILLFRKRIEKTEKETGVEVEGDLLESIFDRHLSTCTSMEDLIAQYFQQADGGNQLKLLGIKSIGAAVKAYIDKDDKDAIRLIVENQVHYNHRDILQKSESWEILADLSDSRLSKSWLISS